MKKLNIALSASFSDGNMLAREGYYKAIYSLGGYASPLVPSTDNDYISELIARFDGFIFCGGGDIDPIYYGEKAIEGLRNTCLARDEFEYRLFIAAYASNKPILGICRGMQVINVFLGGSLHQHIDGHVQVEDRGVLTHEVKVQRGELLDKIIEFGTDERDTAAHCAVVCGDSASSARGAGRRDELSGVGAHGADSGSGARVAVGCGNFASSARGAGRCDELSGAGARGADSGAGAHGADSGSGAVICGVAGAVARGEVCRAGLHDEKSGAANRGAGRRDELSGAGARGEGQCGEVNARKVMVNSFHHQAIKALAPGLRTDAVSHDGYIEAFHHESHRFLLGVQWHPEAFYDKDICARGIFEAFLRACE